MTDKMTQCYKVGYMDASMGISPNYPASEKCRKEYMEGYNRGYVYVFIPCMKKLNQHKLKIINDEDLVA